MANKKKELVKRFIGNISSKVALDAYNSVGGVVKVNELPKVGEDNVIYEMTKEKDGSYSWVLECVGNSKHIIEDYGAVVVDVVPPYDENLEIVYYDRINDRMFYDSPKRGRKELEKGGDGQFATGFEVQQVLVCKEVVLDGDKLTLTRLNGRIEVYENWQRAIDNYQFIAKLKRVSSDEHEWVYSYLDTDGTRDIVNFSALPILQLNHFPNADEFLNYYIYSDLIGNQGYTIIKKDNTFYMNQENDVTLNYAFDGDRGEFLDLNSEEPYNTYHGELVWNEVNFDKTPLQNKMKLSETTPEYIFQPLPSYNETTKWVYDKGQYIGAGLIAVAKELPEDGYKNAIYQLSNSVVQGGNWVLETITSRYGQINAFSTYVVESWDEVNTYKNDSGVYTYFYNRITNELRAYLYNSKLDEMELIFEFEETESGSFRGVDTSGKTEITYEANIYLNVSNINDFLRGTVTRLDGTIEEDVPLSMQEQVPNVRYLGNMILKEVKGQELYVIHREVYEDDPGQAYDLRGLPMQTYTSIEELPNAEEALDYVDGDGVMYAKVGDTVYVNLNGTEIYSWGGGEFLQIREEPEAPQYKGALEWEEVTIEATVDSIPPIVSETEIWTKFYLINEVPSIEYHVFQNFILDSTNKWVPISEEYTDKEE